MRWPGTCSLLFPLVYFRSNEQDLHYVANRFSPYVHRIQYIIMLSDWNISFSDTTSSERESSVDSATRRNEVFHMYYHEHVHKKESVFNLNGLSFYKFTGDCIAFRFRPHKVINFIYPSVRFYCILRYDGERWRLTKNHLPYNYKWEIYNTIWGINSCDVTDGDVFGVIFNIYECLVDWSNSYQAFKEDRCERFRNGDPDVDLFSDEEEFFLSEEERVDWRARKDRILARMVPPPKQLRRGSRKRQRVRLTEFSSTES